MRMLMSLPKLLAPASLALLVLAVVQPAYANSALAT
jgi:hypothetical protein